MDNKTLLLGIIALIFGSMLLYQKCEPESKCLPDFIHTAYSDSLKAVDNVISYADAKTMIERFRQDSICQDNIFPDFQSIKTDAIFDLINRKGIVGVRFYYGEDTDNVIKLILMGINADGTSNTILCIDKVRVPGSVDDGIFP